MHSGLLGNAHSTDGKTEAHSHAAWEWLIKADEPGPLQGPAILLALWEGSDPSSVIGAPWQVLISGGHGWGQPAGVGLPA